MYDSVFPRPTLPPVFPQFRPPAQSAAQVSRTGTLYICAVDCTVRCLMFSKSSEKFNYRPLTVMSSLHFFDLLHLLECRSPELDYKTFKSHRVGFQSTNARKFSTIHRRKKKCTKYWNVQKSEKRHRPSGREDLLSNRDALQSSQPFKRCLLA